MTRMWYVCLSLQCSPTQPAPPAPCWLGNQRPEVARHKDCLTARLTGQPVAPDMLPTLLPRAPSSQTEGNTLSGETLKH